MALKSAPLAVVTASSSSQRATEIYTFIAQMTQRQSRVCTALSFWGEVRWFVGAADSPASSDEGE